MRQPTGSLGAAAECSDGRKYQSMVEVIIETDVAKGYLHLQVLIKNEFTLILGRNQGPTSELILIFTFSSTYLDAKCFGDFKELILNYNDDFFSVLINSQSVRL